MSDVLQIEQHPCTRHFDDNSLILPEELIVEILRRLPVRSLLQLKCICKSWKTLISDSQFAKNQLRFSTENPSITHHQLVFSFKSEIVTYPLKQLFENSSTRRVSLFEIPSTHRVKPVSLFGVMRHEYRIIGSCNGLLCLFDSRQLCVKLCNPFIRLKSSKSPKAFWLDWVIKYYGFGYDQVNDNYKVLVVVQNKDDFRETFTKIYTFGKGSWKTIQNFPYTSTSKLGKFVGGTLNWIVEKRGVSSNENMILSFDLEKETYREVMLPQNEGENSCTRRKLCVLSNCLCVCDTFASEKIDWVVWLMEEYGVVESWTKLIIIPHGEFAMNFAIVKPLFISENGFVLLLNKFFSQLILYNLNGGGLSYPLIRNTCEPDAHIYCESLVSPRW